MAISMYMYVHKIFQAKNDSHAKCVQGAKKLTRRLRWRRFAEKKRLTMMMNRKKKNWVCPLCRQIYRSKQSLDRHVCRPIRNGTLCKPFMCDSCGKSYSTIAYLKNHVCYQNSKNLQERPHTCSHCSRVFKREQTFTLHIEKEHAHQVSECTTCQNGERNRPSYCCHQCGIRFKAELTLKMHTEQEHSLPTSQSKLHIELDRFQSSSQSELYIEQDEQNQSLPSSSQSELHTEQDHSPLCSSQCAACQASFNDDTALRRHLVRIHLKLFVCEVCGEGHPSEISLKSHHSIIHRSRS